MASPFKFFRTHQAGMMVVMVILSMMLFTLDSLFSDTGRKLWLLGILLGGTVFGIAGMGQGRWLQWGFGGALLGGLLGFILPDFIKPPGLYNTTLGVLDAEAIADLEVRRQIANQFLRRAGQETESFPQPFGFGPADNMEQDVVFGRLMRAEADELGISVTDQMVNEYIKDATAEKLSKKSFAKIRQEFSYQNQPVNDDTLYSFFVDEIKAMMAFRTTYPVSSVFPPAPEVYWQHYRRFNVRQQLNTAALEVDAFLDKVSDPSPQEVTELFEMYKDRFPGRDNPGDPGFRLDHRTRIAYLELDYGMMESSVPAVTDQDVQTYYDENKETRFKTPVIPDVPMQPETPESDTPESAEPESNSPETDTPKKDAPGSDAPGSDKPGTPTSEKPKTENQEPGAATSAEPKDGSSETASEKPNTDQPPAESEKPAQDAQSVSSEDAKNDETEDTPEADQKKTEEGSDGTCGFDEDSAELDSTANESKTDESKTDESQTTADETADSATVSQSEAAANPNPSEDASAPNQSTPDQAADDAAPPKLPLIIPPVPDSTKNAPAEDAAQASTPEIQYEYRELDDDLKAEIRDELLRQRVREAIDEKMLAAAARMQELNHEREDFKFSIIEASPTKYEGFGDDYSAAHAKLREQVAEFSRGLTEKLKSYAAENGFEYVETPLVSYADLQNEEDYPIGTATPPSENPMMASQASTVAYNVFSTFSTETGDKESAVRNNDNLLFRGARAVRTSFNLDSGESHYAYWCTEFSFTHVPTLDEPGIRETVVKTWKRLKARELVKARGEELVASIEEGLGKEDDARKSMAETLEDQSITGDDDSGKLAVRQTLPFSWLRTSSASPTSFQQQASMSTIQFKGDSGEVLENVGGEFMKTIFEDMQNDSVAVVPNFDRSRYYVVHVTDRFPTPEFGEDDLRERFAREGKFAAFITSPMLRPMQQQVGGEADRKWRARIWEKYDAAPDSGAVN